MKYDNIKKELLELSETIANLPKIEGSYVPEAYFDKLPEQIWAKISAKEHKVSKESTRVIPLFSKLVGVAASIVLLFFIINGHDGEQSTEEIPLDMMVEFLMDDIGELDEDFLFELHEESQDMAELEDETLEYFLDQEIHLIDDKILETIY